MSHATVGRKSSSFMQGGLVLFFLVVLAAGCTLTLISPYDEQIDQSATALQQKMDRFLSGLVAAPQPSYKQSAAFYDDYMVDLRSLLLRAQCHPKNTITERQIDLMMKNLALVDIAQLAVLKKVKKQQAQALMRIHKNTTTMVLLTIEGLGIIAVENAVNAALSAVGDAINAAAGLKIL